VQKDAAWLDKKMTGPTKLINGGHAAHRGFGLELLCLSRHFRAQVHRVAV
jgi:hypothetical protein